MTRDAMRSVLRTTKALADLQRVRILMLLRPGELCVCQIVAVLGLATSTVSKHLSILNGAGLVESRKEGRWAYYRRPGRAAPAATRDLLRWLDRALDGDAATRQDIRRVQAAGRCAPGVEGRPRGRESSP